MNNPVVFCGPIPAMFLNVAIETKKLRQKTTRLLILNDWKKKAEYGD